MQKSISILIGLTGACLFSSGLSGEESQKTVPIVERKEMPPPLAAIPNVGYDQILSDLYHDEPASAAQLGKTLAEAGDARAQFIIGLLSDLGVAVRLDPEKAKEWLEKSSAQGCPEAQHYLAFKYETGFGLEKADSSKIAPLRANPLPKIDSRLEQWIRVKDGKLIPNFQRAYLWMLRQAHDGDALAEANLANAFLGTAWTRPSLVEHLAWLKKAGEHKDAPSLERLSLYYERGFLVKADAVVAMSYRQAAATAGSASAQEYLGRQFEEGDGVEKNFPEAAKWYRLAAAQDYPSALDHLVTLLVDGAPGLAKDYSEAYKWAERGATLGHAESLVNLGRLYDNGRGVSQDKPKAATLYRQAAAKGSRWALDLLGQMYVEGQLGTPDYDEARRWFEQGAALGSNYAQRNLGALYYDGHGVEQNYAKAFEWYEKAARDNDSWAQNQVGWMLRQGTGIEVDNAEAVDWFRLAAKNGQFWAEANLGYHYANGLGVERDRHEAFLHLVKALRQTSDSWTESVLTDVLINSTKEEKPTLEPELAAGMADPTVMEAVGSLPEIFLRAAESYPSLQTPCEINAAFTKRLIDAQRARSGFILAWKSFLGWGMPYDLIKARQYAREYEPIDSSKSAYLIAAIDSVAADTMEGRTKARAKLHQIADQGDSDALLCLAYRYAEGIGESRHDAVAIHYFNLVAEVANMKKASTIEAVRKSLGIPAPVRPLSDETLAEKIKLGGVGKLDAQISIIQAIQPVYPHDLRQARIEGEAVVDIVVDTAGHPSSVNVISATHPLFGLAAESASWDWRFSPGRKDGEAIATKVRLPMRFIPDEPSETKVNVKTQPRDPTP